ncbi:MAG: CopD family protein [Alphaproteobacteria bacterium]|nr:CopD family protein [Alphaproteobacteria bacterium]
MSSVLLALHTLAAIVWVGGMFFAHMALRLAVVPMAPKDRLELWGRVFPRFFPWVWLAVAVLLGSGWALVLTVHGGMAGAGLHIHLMNGLGTLMMALFVLLFFGPYARLRRALAKGDLPRAAAAQGWIRRIVLVNLSLGLFVSALAAGGRYWG